MKKLSFCTWLALLFSLLYSCKEGTNNNAQLHDEKIYHQAVRFGDVGTAIHATHSMLARDTEAVKYYDTLSVLYFQSNNYPQAIQAAQHVLEKDTNNQKLVEVTARAYQAIGEFELAVPFFHRLARLNDNPEMYYQMGVCQFYMQQFDAAEQSVNKVISNPRSAEMELIIGFNNNTRQQQAPLLAAAYNMLGSIKYQKNEESEARANFAKALSIYPDFALPKENLAKLKQ